MDIRGIFNLDSQKDKTKKIEKKTSDKTSKNKTKNIKNLIQPNNLNKNNLSLSKYAVESFQNLNKKTLVNNFLKKFDFDSSEQLLDLNHTLTDTEVSDYFGNIQHKELYEKIKDDELLLKKLKRGTEQEATVMFIDIRHFTKMTIDYSPEKIFKMLNLIFPFIIDTIISNGGYIDKLIGDAVLCYFGLPKQITKLPHQLVAVNTAVAIQKSINLISSKVEKLDYPKIKIGIGVNSGIVKTGFLGGSKSYQSFTIIGGTVNLASKFEGLAGEDEILVGESLLDYILDDYDVSNEPKIFSLRDNNDTLNVKCFQVFY